MLKWDEYFNYRDSVYRVGNPIVQSVIYRGCSPFTYQSENNFTELIRSLGIKTRIDLRSKKEKDQKPVFLPELHTVEIEVDPLKNYTETDSFWDEDGELMRRVYHFIAFENHNNISKTIEAVNNTDGAILIHCEAGRDRTGIFIAFLQLLSGATKDNVLQGFSLNVHKERIELFKEVLDTLGDNPKDFLTKRIGLKSKELNNFSSKYASG